MPWTRLLFALLFFISPAVGSITAVKLHVPRKVPSTASKPVPRDFGSLSIEPAFWTEFWGNSTHPNDFSFKLLKNIQDRTGVPPMIRTGGVTQDSSYYDPSTPSVKRILGQNGTIYKTALGDEFYKSFKHFPKDTKFIIPLNFGNNSLDIAINQTNAAIQLVKDRQLYAFELGNEAGNFKAHQRNLSTWGTDEYVKQWLNWTTAINRLHPTLEQPRWWAGSDGTTDDPNTVAIQTDKIVERGINDGRTILEFSQHMYQYSSCRPASNARAIVPNIFNHTNITAFVDILKPKVAAAVSVESDFVVGEFNSVSCSGKPNITDTFGQALWVIDTSLYSASINISRVFLHQGATLVSQSDEQLNIPGVNGTPGFSTYDLWYPINSPLRGARRANPSYVSQLFIAEAIGKSDHAQIAHLDAPAGINATGFAAYAIYERSKLSRLAVLNIQQFNRTTGTADTNILLDLSDMNPAPRWLKRLTAPGLDEPKTDLVTWAGQSYTSGTAHGVEAKERVKGGLVGVRGSEAVLVFF